MFGFEHSRNDCIVEEFSRNVLCHFQSPEHAQAGSFSSREFSKQLKTLCLCYKNNAHVEIIIETVCL